MSADAIDSRRDAIGRRPFRARFHLSGRERALVELRGMPVIREHAADLIHQRVAPADLRKDGAASRGPARR